MKTDETVVITADSIRIDTFHAGEHSGFVHTSRTAVRITHLPTGVTVESRDEPTAWRNRQKCLDMLPAAIAQHRSAGCTCPSGDGSLRHPCPVHPASGEQAGGDERAAFEAWATHLPMDRQYLRPDLYMPPTQWAWDAWQARAALVQPSPAPTLRAAIDVANDRFEVPVAKWGTDLAGEKERPEVVAFIHERTGTIANADMVRAMEEGSVPSGYTGGLMTVTQHDRMALERWQYFRRKMRQMRDLMRGMRDRLNAAQARVAELEMILRELNTSGLMQFSTADEEKAVRAALSGAQAQHSAGYAEARQCVNCRHIGINDSADYAACHDCNWTGPEPDEDKCPGCAGENCMAAACPECGGRYDLVAEANITAPAGQVPQAWLDVQAERLRQIEAEGWTPEHDDEHSHGQMARAAACYALAGSSAPNDGAAALLVSLAWPWDEQWWKPSTARRDLVKACSLALAEIERLDRAGISQSPQPGATTASS
ncbi:peptide chain release factor-like protein [Pseudomonas aeruginosa]|uniref:peptide chain release factor-like protein n=1 Tax=Pseudomonas aeruginosa TaxID=287 RepID=UPI0034D171D7